MKPDPPELSDLRALQVRVRTLPHLGYIADHSSMLDPVVDRPRRKAGLLSRLLNGSAGSACVPVPSDPPAQGLCEPGRAARWLPDVHVQTPSSHAQDVSLAVEPPTAIDVIDSATARWLREEGAAPDGPRFVVDERATEPSATEPSPGNAPPAPQSPAEDQPSVPPATTRWLPQDKPAVDSAARRSHAGEQRSGPPAATRWLPEEQRRAEGDPVGEDWLPADSPTATTVADPKRERSRWLVSEAAAIQVQPARAERAVHIYCRELCAPLRVEQAVEQSLAAFEASSSPSAAGEDELLRITRVIAARYTSAAVARLGSSNLSAAEDECRKTPERLATRANGELDVEEHVDLQRHLDGCPRCQASELRAARAEQGFVTTLAGASVPEVPGASALGESATAEVPTAAAAVSLLVPATAAAANAAVTAEPVETFRPSSVLSRRPLARRRHRLRLLAGVGVAAAAVAVATLLLLDGGARGTTPVRASSSTPTPTAVTTAHRAVKPATHRAGYHRRTAHKPAAPAPSFVGGDQSSTSSPPVPSSVRPSSPAPVSPTPPSSLPPSPSSPRSGAGSSSSGGSGLETQTTSPTQTTSSRPKH